ncbi:MAG: class I SAM-dependent methyltransferase [Solirubrobacterales bacterium]
MSAQFHWDPETYLERIRAEIPRFDELQEAAIEAVPFPPKRVLDLGVGTGETARRLLEAYPEAEITGLDSSPEMLFRARELGIETRLARMEDPLPDGPWDLVIAVLSVNELDDEGKHDLLRRVREESRSLVVADAGAAGLAESAGGEVTWSADDLAVVAATYEYE